MYHDDGRGGEDTGMRTGNLGASAQNAQLEGQAVARDLFSALCGMPGSVPAGAPAGVDRRYRGAAVGGVVRRRASGGFLSDFLKGAALVVATAAMIWAYTAYSQSAPVPQRVASYDIPTAVAWGGDASYDLPDAGGVAFYSDPIPNIYESGGLLTCPLASIPPTSGTATMVLQGTSHLYTNPGTTTSWYTYSSDTTGACSAIDGGSTVCGMDFSSVHARS